ncbi:MAG: hypothetical protein NVS2B4_16380 [Ramlibacter sp.]
MDSENDRTASLITPAKLAQVSGDASSPIASVAFLDRMAADIGHQHVQRLAELCQQLDEQGQGRLEQVGQVEAALRRMLDALAGIDFAPLQERSWWADFTGKSRTAATAFTAGFDRVDEVAQELAAAVAVQHRQQGQRTAPHDRLVVEFDVEYHALDKVIGQGARWLQDLRNQARVRQAEPGVSAHDVRADDARCELLVQRLKLLRAAATASQLAHQEVLVTIGRRAEMGESLNRLTAIHLQSWRASLSALAAAAVGDKIPASLIGEAVKAQDKLRGKLEGRLADLAQLGSHESALVGLLAAMGEQLAETA